MIIDHLSIHYLNVCLITKVHIIPHNYKEEVSSCGKDIKTNLLFFNIMFTCRHVIFFEFVHLFFN